MSNSGWICPKCEAVMAPFHPTCWYCKPVQKIPVSSVTGIEPMKLPSCRHVVVGECIRCQMDRVTPDGKPMLSNEKGYDGHVCYAKDIHRIDLIAGSTINPDFEIPM